MAANPFPPIERPGPSGRAAFHPRKVILMVPTRSILAAAFLILAPAAISAQNAPAGAHADSPAVSYSDARIDLGLIVRDVDRAVAFYKGALGLKRAYGFEVDADFATEAGLTDGHPLNVVALRLTDAADAPILKLVRTGEPEADRPRFITDRSGVRYLTVNVTALGPLLERLRQHEVPVLANGPVLMGNGQHLALVQDPDGVFIELIGPMEAPETP